MRICLVTPVAQRTYHGNWVTAERWAAILGDLGHQVAVLETYDDRPADLLIALHARKSAPAVQRFRALHQTAPIVLALTGTDLYPTLAPTDRPVLALADRYVVLQPLGVDQLPADLRNRARVIYQSVALVTAGQPGGDHFDALVLAHLRPVKDPLLAAAAARVLPADSQVRIRHAGAVIDPDLGARAAAESATNPHYDWLGELPRPAALRLLAESRLLLLTSRHEGGANAVSEALAAGVPVLATRIPGTVGMLGPDYPGYFPVGDPAALAELLAHTERDRDGLYSRLRQHCGALRPLVAPETERDAWRALLTELTA